MVWISHPICPPSVAEPPPRQIFLVLAAVVGVIVYRIAVKAAVAGAGDAFLSSQASIITSITASCISLVVIMILQNVSGGVVEFTKASGFVPPLSVVLANSKISVRCSRT